MATYELLNDYNGTFAINENNQIVTLKALVAQDYIMTLRVTDKDVVIEHPFIIPVVANTFFGLSLDGDPLALGNTPLGINLGD